MQYVIGPLRSAAHQVFTRPKLVVTTLIAGILVWAIAKLLISLA